MQQRRVDRLDKGADSRKTPPARKHLKIPPTASVLGGVFRMSEEKRLRSWLDATNAATRRTRISRPSQAGIGRWPMKGAAARAMP
ncbi:hypothetical protein [Reyranella sp.]|uniref:hypothetical protein n=1 Tax=Reyranella sp. TaxID=1929291 RepID=UPI003D12768A